MNDWAAIMPDVARRLLGKPDRETRREWRYGSKGSLAVYLESGTWKDYESGEGGGILDLVNRELQTDRQGALDWLKREGFLNGQAARMPVSALSAPTPNSQQREPDPIGNGKPPTPPPQVLELSAAAVSAENTPAQNYLTRFWCRQPTGIGDNEIWRIVKRNGILYLPDVGSKTTSFFSAFAGISASN